ncbi:MAG: DNA-3-methyladenine glycosylase [Phycisphaerales bacterium]
MFARDAAAVAQALLGATIVRITDQHHRLAATITETEAYIGPEDLASHARRGHRSPRNESMWQAPGTAYVYFTYGMHHCFNVSCLRADHPAAVLIRAARPVDGIEQLTANRTAASRARAPIPAAQLLNGPAKLCQAMRIDRSLDAHDLCASNQLWIEQSAPIPSARITTAPRIGIDYAGEWAEAPLRFILSNT